LVEYVTGAEALGIDCCWVADAPDAGNVLHAIATCTRSLLVGTGVMRLEQRTVAGIATAAREMVDASAGRFLLGLGIGPGERPVERMRATIAALREDRHVEQVPIYVGAIGPRMLRCTGELADGWLASTHVAFEPGLIAVQQAAEDCGRRPDALERCVPVWVGPDLVRDCEGARAAGATMIRLIPAGSSVAEQLSSLQEAKARLP